MCYFQRVYAIFEVGYLYSILLIRDDACLEWHSQEFHEECPESAQQKLFFKRRKKLFASEIQTHEH